jgi:Transposase DDE domain/Transposase IS66 family
LVEEQLLPLGRVQRLLADLFDVRLGRGTLVGWIQRAARVLEPVETQLTAALQRAPVLHNDETGVRRSGSLAWAHVASTSRLTHYALHRKRGREATDAIGILPAYAGVSVHDGWTPYQTHTRCRHALCKASTLSCTRPSMSIVELYCSVDTFWQQFAPLWEREEVATGKRRRRRACRLSASELMTILILFQQSGYRTFKGFYRQHVQAHLRAEFPGLVSYNRFVELMPRVLVPLAVYLQTQMGMCTGISFIDSTSLSVCKNARSAQHRVFAVGARRSKTSVGWFYGFKLHLVVNDRGKLLAFCLTPGNVDDRRPVPRLARRLVGKLFGHRGYISQALAEQ